MEPAATLGHALSQGALTALPLSSSGHTVVWALAFGGGAPSPGTRALVQLAAVAALVVVVRRRLGAAIAAGLRGLAKPSHLQDEDAGRDAVALIVASVTAAVACLSLQPLVSPLHEVPLVAGLGLFATAMALVSTVAAPPPSRLMPRAPGALLTGLAWGLAVLPGASPAAMAFVVGRWLGVGRWRAAEMALIVGIPALVLDASRVLLDAGVERIDLRLVTMVVVLGFVGAAAAATLWRLLCDRERTPALALWLVPLSLATIAYDRALPHPTDSVISESDRAAMAPPEAGAAPDG